MMSLTMTQLRLPLPAILHTEFDAMVDHACCLSTLGQALRYDISTEKKRLPAMLHTESRNVIPTVPGDTV